MGISLNLFFVCLPTRYEREPIITSPEGGTGYPFGYAVSLFQMSSLIQSQESTTLYADKSG